MHSKCLHHSIGEVEDGLGSGCQVISQVEGYATTISATSAPLWSATILSEECVAVDLQFRVQVLLQPGFCQSDKELVAVLQEVLEERYFGGDRPRL